jgi:MFS family permease
VPPVDQVGRRGRRRAGPGGRRRAGRLRELLLSGVVDSFGNSLGWTVVLLIGTARGGLREAALYSAAMLVGTVLSAPATGWLSRRLTGRWLLRGTATVEATLRLATLGALVAGFPAGVVAIGIALLNIAAWTGYAGMRAEVSAVDGSPRSMTRYAVGIAGVEAAGTALAALLPKGAAGYPAGWLLGAVFLAYAGSMLPTMVTARRARIAPLPGASRSRLPGPGIPTTEVVRRAHAGVRLPSVRLLIAGGGIMLTAAGPVLLAVPVTEELHGSAWVAAAAVAFSLGTLLSTTAIHLITKLRLPAVLRWTLWGLGMLVGWIFAPAYAPMVLFAQFSAGLSQTAFEGDMDARVAEEAPPAAVTRDLAYSASVRALGGAVAVRLLPVLVAAPEIGTVASIAGLVLGGAALVLWAGLSTVPHLVRRLAH